MQRAALFGCAVVLVVACTDRREPAASTPAVRDGTDAFAADTATAKAARTLELAGRWRTLGAAVPADINALAARIDRLPAGPDTARARAALNAAASLWSKAQAAFATGNLEEAVDTAQRVDGAVDALATTVNCPRPGCLRSR